MKFLLNNARSSEHRIEIDPVTRQATLTQLTKFNVSLIADMLVTFIQAVKNDKTIRHTYTDDEWNFEYEPPTQGVWRTYLHCFTLTRKNGYHISMGYSTAYKLLDALTDKTERLIQE